MPPCIQDGVIERKVIPIVQTNVLYVVDQPLEFELV